MAQRNQTADRTPHPLAVTRTELVWEGKYNSAGNRVAPLRVATKGARPNATFTEGTAKRPCEKRRRAAPDWGASTRLVFAREKSRFYGESQADAAKLFRLFTYRVPISFTHNLGRRKRVSVRTHRRDLTVKFFAGL